MIKKKAVVTLTQAEIDSGKLIEVLLVVQTPEGNVDYRITYNEGGDK